MSGERASRPQSAAVFGRRPKEATARDARSLRARLPLSTALRDNRRVAWKIEKQANGKFAIYSTRIDDYIVIDADPLAIAQLYAEKGVKVYLASARAQLAKELPVSASGEEKIAASRQRGTPPKEGSVPIGVTGFSIDEE